MSDKVQESLSALMDNEADDLELRRILKKMPGQGDALKEKWARYHLISASLKQEVHSRPAVDLLSGIHAILDEEPIPVRPAASASRLPGVFRYLGQSAIAASVALGVLFTAQYLDGPRDGEAGMASLAGAAGVQAPVTTTGEYQAGELTRTASFSEAPAFDEDTRDRLSEAVYREFERGARAYEVPVNYVPAEN